MTEPSFETAKTIEGAVAIEVAILDEEAIERDRIKAFWVPGAIEDGGRTWYLCPERPIDLPTHWQADFPAPVIKHGAQVNVYGRDLSGAQIYDLGGEG